MIASFILTPSAARDLDEILEFVFARGGANAALHIHQRFYAAFAKLGEQPGIGHSRNDLADESLRAWAVFSYLVLYHPKTVPVQIIRVIHGARDIPNAIEFEE